MKTFHEDRRLIYTFPQGTLVLVSASEDCWRHNGADFSSRTRFTCPRAPLLVLETRAALWKQSSLRRRGGGRPSMKTGDQSTRSLRGR